MSTTTTGGEMPGRGGSKDGTRDNGKIILPATAPDSHTDYLDVLLDATPTGGTGTSG